MRDDHVPIYDLLDRTSSLFELDIDNNKRDIAEIIQNSRFLIIGGAGSIGRAVVREIFKRQAKLLHVVDILDASGIERLAGP